MTIQPGHFRNQCGELAQIKWQVPHIGFGSSQLDEVAWFEENSAVQNTLRPHPVGSKKANGYGLYDMTGNVAEWVWDFYGAYPKTTKMAPDDDL